MRTFLLTALCLACTVLPSFGDTSDHAYDWVLIYVMSYDNNLEGCGPVILDGLESGVRSERVAVTVLADFTDTEGMQRYEMTSQGRTVERLESDDSASEEELGKYLDWAVERYDGAKYAIVFLNHGGDLDDMCLDEQPGGGSTKTWLSAKKVGPQLAELREKIEGQVELVFLQQCGRGSIDNLYNFRNTGAVVMASQTTVGAPNTYYDPTVRWLGENPDASGAELARRIMADDRHYTNYVSVDGAALAELPERLDPLVEALLEGPAAPTGLKPCFGGWYRGAETNYDLLGWLTKATGDNEAAAEQLGSFEEWVTESLIVDHERLDRRTSRGWSGLALFVPESRRVRGKYADYPLYEDSRLDELWDALYPRD